MTHERLRTGAEGEDRARESLERAGYRILSRNYRCRHGEVDLVAQDGEVIAFVEVKARRSETYGIPALAVTRAKRRRILRAALHWLVSQGMPDRPVRFDVVSLRQGPAGWEAEILRGAFTADR